MSQDPEEPTWMFKPGLYLLVQYDIGSVLVLGETLLREKDGADIVVRLHYLFYHDSQTLLVSNNLHLKACCISLDQMIFISKNVVINY